jgi:hypothetical protein
MSDDEFTVSLPSEIGTLTTTAKTMAGVFSDVDGAVGVAIAIAKAMGVLDRGVDLRIEFDRLHAHLSELARKMDNNRAAEEWLDRTIRQKTRLTESLTAAITAKEKAENKEPLERGGNEMTDSRNHAQYLSDFNSPEFLRFYQRGDRSEVNWRFVGDHAIGEINRYGYGYDWRSGIPELMQLIALRLQVIAAFDSEFRIRKVFQTELKKYYEALEYHRSKMIDGIQCGIVHTKLTDDWREPGLYDGSPWNTDDYRYEYGCVDIYTGVQSRVEFVLASEILPPSELPIDLATFQPDRLYELIGTRLPELRAEVVRRLPLSDIQSMIDTLHLYAHLEVSGPPQWPDGVVDGDLIKSPSDPRVYLVENRTKRWIPDEATFLSTWTWDMVKEVSEEAVNAIPTGSDISSV